MRTRCHAHACHAATTLTTTILGMLQAAARLSHILTCPAITTQKGALPIRSLLLVASPGPTFIIA